MKTRFWLALVSVLALPPLACSSSDVGGQAADAGGNEGGTDGSADATPTGDHEDSGVDGNAADDSNDDATEVGSDVDTNPVRQECRAAAYSVASCGPCMEAHCAQECDACFADPQCMSWIECVTSCLGQACEDACTQQYPTGQAAALAWYGSSGCAGTECGDKCPGGIATQYCDAGPVSNNPVCDSCLQDNCCAEVKSCQADPSCNDCMTNGTTNDCGGNAVYAPLDVCWQSICGSACGGGGCGLSTNGSEPACDTCIEANCCDQDIACSSGVDANHNGNPDCFDVLLCTQQCTSGDTACVHACKAAQPAGAALLDELQGCLSQKCPAICPF